MGAREPASAVDTADGDLEDGLCQVDGDSRRMIHGLLPSVVARLRLELAP
jgi:hypothetical protein